MERSLARGQKVRVKGQFPGNDRMSWRTGTIDRQTGDFSNPTYLINLTTSTLQVQQTREFIVSREGNL